ncbi:cupin domain-containing protein [Haloarculaceae archaeon H-GB2-1]|nr:cupin domain-containing protein [Haloarculaceae archaeon H-GB1-1]MEA5387695.1 cupin domain-containing protein [Haloarculaceae archaeon H-GB11]MEA5409185.1 cupin domain-containing protein [Haloarculaceae archaeon H-GB2-1]
MDEAFAIVDPEDVDTGLFNTCDVSHRKLTEPLGCSEMRVNQVRLEPGDVTTPHAHEGQEEVFVAMTDGRIEIDDEVRDVSRGTVVRVGPEPMRSLRNDRDEETQVWLAFGAPPVGTIDGFGSYVVADE